MNKKLFNMLLLILSLGLLIAGAIFLCISIFGENKTTTPLAIALGCILISNLSNLIRQLNNKEN